MDFVLAPIGELRLVDWQSAKPKRGAEMSEVVTLKDAGIAVVDNRIVAVGNSSDVLREFSSIETIDCAGKLVTPGLIDCHTHLVWAGNRADEFLRRAKGETYEDIAQSGGGILSTMRAVRNAKTNELAEGIIRRSRLMLEYGTVAFEIKASYGLSLDACLKELDAILIAQFDVKQRMAVTFMGAHAFPPECSRSEYMQQLIEEILPIAAKHPCEPKHNDVFCESGAFDVDEAEQILRAGLQYGLKPKIHSDEFHVLGGTEMACNLGAVSCDHLLASREPQWAALAQSDTIAVTMPGTAYYLGKPYANARAMIDAGCAVALGTDWNPGSSMVASMPFVMGLAVTKMGLSPEEALSAATVNAAHACSLSMRETDLCVWPCSTLEEFIYAHTFARAEMVFIGAERIQ